MRPHLHIASDDLIQRILAEAKRILAEVGVEVMGETLRRLMLERGLRQHPATGRVLFPPEVVEQAIASTPRAIMLYRRDGAPHATLGGDRVHFVPGSSALNVLDWRTNEHRAALTADFIEYVQLADRLPNIAYLATAFSTNDMEPQVSDAWRLYLCLRQSLKPVVSGAFTEHGVPRMGEMMQLFRQDRADLAARPLAIFTVTPTGMFRFSEDSSQNLVDCVAWGIPVEIVPVTLMGLIAPVTPVGAAAFHMADALSGLTMAQLLRPGHPVLVGGAPATFHMKLASSPMAAVEAWQVDALYLAAAKALGLPTQAYMALSDGKVVDAQAGAETFGSALLAALAGVNSVSGPGMLNYVLTFSLEKLVLDDELCGQALWFAREIEPVDDLPATDLISELLAEKHLLTADHTQKYWWKEMYFPNPVVDRLNRDNWELGGEQTLQQRARAEIEKHLRAFTPPPLDPRLEAEMRRLVQSGLTAGAELPVF